MTQQDYTQVSQQAQKICAEIDYLTALKPESASCSYYTGSDQLPKFTLTMLLKLGIISRIVELEEELACLTFKLGSTIEIVEAGVDPAHQTDHCDCCWEHGKFNSIDLVKTTSHTGPLTLCQNCYNKAGNSVR